MQFTNRYASQSSSRSASGCTCRVCPGAGCTCGCAPQASDSRCSCGPNCGCAPACHCGTSAGAASAASAATYGGTR